MIEELYIKIFPTAFESYEQETGTPLADPSEKASGHGLEAGYADRSRTGRERDPACSCKSNTDAGEAAGSDRCANDVQGRPR